MQITFAKQQLQKVCESEKELRRAYGADCAMKVMARLADLRAAANLATMRSLPGRCHRLAGDRDGQLGIVLVGARRLVLRPTDGWPDTGETSADAWAEIDSVELLEIVDYHDG